MRKLITLLALLLAFSFSLVAQEAEQDNITENPEVEVPAESAKEPEIQTDEDYVFKLNQPGDWFVKVGVNGAFPIQPATMNFGLDLNLGFYYFLAPFFAVGGDISFDYNHHSTFSITICNSKIKNTYIYKGEHNISVVPPYFT